MSHSDIDEALDHVILAIDKTSNGTIGCACYIARDELLLCMEDIEKGDQDVVNSLKLELQPTAVVVSHRANQSHTPSSGNDFLPYETIIRPSSDFDFSSALKKLLSNRSIFNNLSHLQFMVPGQSLEAIDRDTGMTCDTGQLLSLSSYINLDSRVSVGCAGAVITQLSKKRAAEFLPGDIAMSEAYKISKIESFTLKETMLLNIDTFAALQIIEPEAHPNAARRGPGASGSKESFSVFGLFYHFAKTPHGRLRLRQIFLRPSLNIQTLHVRQEFISVLTKAENQVIAGRLSKSLAHIKNLRNIMTNLRKGISGPQGKIKAGNWSTILEFCFHTIDITDALSEVVGHEHLPLCRSAIDVLDTAQLQRIGRMIHDIVDLEESIDQNRTVINRNINRDLDKAKDAYHGMEDILSTVARNLTAEMPPYVMVSLNVVFLPQLGFHIVVPINSQTGQAVYRDPQWQLRFTTDQHVYMKNDKMQEMDSDLGDLWVIICDTEIEISHDLAQKVLENERMLLAASDICGELDCLLALVHGAIQYKLTRPQLVEDNVINIKAGRHILQEMTSPLFVPNDTFLVGGDSEGPTMIMMTGPNYSGKSVYQKQIALICYMSQIGSFVPAESAIIGITDKILTRINTRETVSKMQSAFMIDLQQIRRALNSCTNRSLLVIDEFGKGTDVCDGAGLASAIFQHLLFLGPNSPKVLANTHFHEIFEDNALDHSRIAFFNMETLVDVSSGCEITYLYNLKAGRSSLSYGVQCAEMNGIPRPVIERANKLTELMVRGDDLVEACSSLPATEIEELEEAEAVARMFLAQDMDSPTAADDIQMMLSELS